MPAQKIRANIRLRLLLAEYRHMTTVRIYPLKSVVFILAAEPVMGLKLFRFILHETKLQISTRQ